jgi:spore coat polysaccharide biosynthesis predicted glycosyltransferase SpsG
VIALGPLVPAQRLEAVREISLGRGNVEILHNASDFPLLLSRARLVICTASVTAYEALAMEKRTAVFSVAPNQGSFGERLARMGVALDLGDWNGIGRDDIYGALSYEPDARPLKGLVKRDGALLCARRLLGLLGGGCCDS